DGHCRRRVCAGPAAARHAPPRSFHSPAGARRRLPPQRAGSARDRGHALQPALAHRPYRRRARGQLLPFRRAPAMSSPAALPDAVLFDLDGTLIDSAPDLLAALDHVRAGLDLPPSGHSGLREHVSRGAGGLLAAGLPGWSEMAQGERDDLRQALLDFYADNCWRRSAPFDGIEALIDRLTALNI